MPGTHGTKPVAEVLTETEMEVAQNFVQGLRAESPKQHGRPSPKDIRGWVVGVAHIAGFRPLTRPPLLRSQLLMRAWNTV